MKLDKDSLSRDLIDFELQVKDLWEAGHIKAPVHFSGGNESQLIDIFQDIKPEDYVLSTHRNHYHYLLKHAIGTEGIILPIAKNQLLNEILGSSMAFCKGRSRSMTIQDPAVKFYTSAIIGGICAWGVGLAKGIKRKGGTETVWCFIGDSVVETGHFHEAIIYANCWELPVMFVLEDNNRATCTPNNVRMNHDYPALIGRISDETTAEFNKPRVKYYRYEPSYPHVGSGKYVAF